MPHHVVPRGGERVDAPVDLIQRVSERHPEEPLEDAVDAEPRPRADDQSLVPRGQRELRAHRGAEVDPGGQAAGARAARPTREGARRVGPPGGRGPCATGRGGARGCCRSPASSSSRMSCSSTGVPRSNAKRTRAIRWMSSRSARTHPIRRPPQTDLPSDPMVTHARASRTAGRSGGRRARALGHGLIDDERRALSRREVDAPGRATRATSSCRSGCGSRASGRRRSGWCAGTPARARRDPSPPAASRPPATRRAPTAVNASTACG